MTEGLSPGPPHHMPGLCVILFSFLKGRFFSVVTFLTQKVNSIFLAVTETFYFKTWT